MMEFQKYQGTGNDFVMIDNRKGGFKGGRERIARLCDRRFGIGADGLILLETSDIAAFKMVYYNADGGESTMCGNGGRCLVRFARDLGACGDRGVFDAVDGLHHFLIDAGQVRLQMKDVPAVKVLESAVEMDTGSPHYVACSDNLEALDVPDEARKVRYSGPYREHGINVNFMQWRDGQIFMRTYERGVEDETLSCGTGTVAVALAAALERPELTSPASIQAPGGALKVYFKRSAGGFSDIWLEGPAEKVFEGRIL